MVKRITKFNNAEIEKYKFHQYKKPILIDNIDINEIVVSNTVSYGKKKILNISLAIKMLSNCEYFFQKGVHIEEILIELNVWLFYKI